MTALTIYTAEKPAALRTTDLSRCLVDLMSPDVGRGLYELAAMFGVANDRMLRALWFAEWRGDVVPMVVKGYVWWFRVPSE